MCCLEVRSDWNEYVYREGQWGVSVGDEVSFTAPTRKLVEEELSHYYGSKSAQEFVIEQVQVKPNLWRATMPHDK